MSETPQNQRQVQLRIDESKMHTTYSNTIRTSTTPDEVVLDFGVHLPMPPNPGEQAQVIMLTLGSRVVMNWRGAKQLAISLGQVIRQFEERNGEIPLGNAQGGPGGPPKLAQ